MEEAGRRYARVDSRILVPVGGSMVAHGHKGSPYERSLVLIDGTLEMTVDGETFPISPREAVYVAPGASWGVRNVGSTAAIFVMTLSPSPYKSFAALREQHRSRGAGIKTAQEM